MTVKLNVAVWLSEPEVPVTVSVHVPRFDVAGTLMVSTEVALPLAAGVTGLLPNVAVTPDGKPETLSVTGALNPLRLVTVVVSVPLAPSAMLRFAGAAARLKFGAGLTLRLIVVECTSAPDVAVTVIVAFPVVAVDAAVNARVAVALPFCGGVTEVGAKDAVTPLGSPVTVKFTGALNAPTLETVIASLPLAP